MSKIEITVSNLKFEIAVRKIEIAVTLLGHRTLPSITLSVIEIEVSRIPDGFSVKHSFIRLYMETRCWCPFERHK